MEPPRWRDSPDQLVIRRAFFIAGETDELCRPIHLLAALAELDGPISTALRRPDGGPLLPRPSDPPPVHGGGAGYLIMQTQGAASQLALERGETRGPEHLFLAVIDQAEPEAVALLTQAGLDMDALRVAALEIVGAAVDTPPIPMPPLTPAGTMDRLPLTEDELDPTAWAILTDRQAHLPVHSLRTPRHWECLRSLEASASARIVKQLRLDDDQDASLRTRHLERVRAIAHQARPDLVPAPRVPPRSNRAIPIGDMLSGRHTGRLHRRRLAFLNFTIGWGTWFSNRLAGARRRWLWLETRWFWLRTRSAYREAPGLT